MPAGSWVAALQASNRDRPGKDASATTGRSAPRTKRRTSAQSRGISIAAGIGPPANKPSHRHSPYRRASSGPPAAVHRRGPYTHRQREKNNSPGTPARTGRAGRGDNAIGYYE